MSEVINANIQLWRQKSADGTITIDEMREAIAAIRDERFKASERSATSRAKKVPKVEVNADDLLSEIL